MIADAESILRVCGMDSYLHIGCGQSKLVFELLKRSIDAFGMDPSLDIVNQHLQRAPGRFYQGSIAEFPFDANSFGTVIVGPELFTYQLQDLATLFNILNMITKNNLVLYFPPEFMQHVTFRNELTNRLFWEKLAIASNFRLHPRSMLVTPYHELENEQLGRFIFLERIPDAANERFSLNWLLENRDLHMDMLREAGRRSDAHISRYVLAASRIRPGDTVLDAACGLGYGTYALAACSPGARFIGVDIDPESVEYATLNFAAKNPAISYQACDVTNLSFIPDHSIDTVISFETIEHVPDYDLFLAEVHRVLKPDGRFVGSVPNLWCDETGNDPNPFHFHVFDWNKLQQAISKYFIVDERWCQIAGGGFTLRDGKRSMYSVPLNDNRDIETEWWLISAVANPLKSPNVPYTNPFQQHTAGSLPAHVDFGKYYDNPWLYRVMVQLGDRISSSDVLINFCLQIISSVRPGSAEQGAALCVVCYQVLESGNVIYDDVISLISSINAYEQACDKNNPHSIRWIISLHYIAGRLLLATGSRDDALATFLSCGSMDTLSFSPLLATKTISAKMYAGLLYFNDGNITEAETQLRQAISEAHRVMQGNWHDILGDLHHPLSFGLQETAEVLDIASVCAQILHAMKYHANTPGYIWDKVNLKRFGLVEWNKSLERENSELRKASTHVRKPKILAVTA